VANIDHFCGCSKGLIRGDVINFPFLFIYLNSLIFHADKGYRLDALIDILKLRNNPLMVVYAFIFSSQNYLTRWLCSSDEPFNTRCTERRRRPDGCARRNLLRQWFDYDLL